MENQLKKDFFDNRSPTKHKDLLHEEYIKQTQQKTIKDIENNHLRTDLYKWIKKITIFYLLFVAIFILLCFYAYCTEIIKISLTPVLITLLATTTFNIIALSFAITKSLFPNDLKIEQQKKDH
jgi:fatty-acid desaturase